nr:immunoglobulin light chain junction region [Macaca mulatta]MPO09438.1 immunoglobulin light chain junction region [Macaca mulatta]MPO09586.1 immunoglobulin light chain junction region [Macaca mulatta]MPO11343.1 immunoglobulin light chain junction region [Macaca mulatta]
CSSYADNNVLF